MTVFVVLVLISTKVHYSIDIVGAVIFTLWMNKYVLSYLAYFDYVFSCICYGLENIIREIKMTIFR